MGASIHISGTGSSIIDTVFVCRSTGVMQRNGVTKERLKAMVKTACQLLAAGAPKVDEDQVHRLDKADTRNGIDSLKNVVLIDFHTPCCSMSDFLEDPLPGTETP